MVKAMGSKGKGIAAIVAIIIIVGAAYLGYSYFMKPAPETLVFGLDWVVYGRHAPYFVALDKGFFAQENLNVTIVRGYGSADAVTRVATGRTNIGFGDMSSLIIARAKDPNIKVKMVAMIYGKAPFTVFTLKSSGISQPKQLENRSLSVAGPGDASYVLFPACAKAAGIDPTKVKWVFVEPAVKTPMLMAGQVDAMTEFIMQKPVLEKAAADKGGINVILWADYGLKLYSNGILMTEDLIKTKPNAVRGFLRALVKGFEYTFNNPDEAATIILKYYPTLEKDVVRAEIDIVKGLALTPEAQQNGIGYLSPEKVQSTLDAIVQAYKLETKIAAGDIYTNEFLPRK